MRRVDLWRVALLLTAAAEVCGCDDHCARTTTIETDQGPVLVCVKPLACGDVDPPSTIASAPSIVDATLASQLAEDPWTLVLTLDFSDSDGNLAAGEASFYLGGDANSRSTQPLVTAFKQSALAEDATSGQLVVPLRFDDNVRDGADVDLGIQLSDGGGLHSNCYGLTLHFEVK